MTKITLRDYSGKAHEIEIDDNVEFVCGVVITGDMVMVYPYHYDTSENRINNYYDGDFLVKREDFEIMNGMTSSYAIQSIIYN